jgi:tRNA G18 (ribose-2'-O)-methylase SpoU
MTPILVFGNENRGVPDELLNSLFGDIVSVRQRGVLRSYNVGVTSGMVMMDMLNNMGWW